MFDALAFHGDWPLLQGLDAWGYGPVRPKQIQTKEAHLAVSFSRQTMVLHQESNSILNI